MSGRQIARDFGISRDSVSKMLSYSEPPGYRRTAPIRRPKLDPYIAYIDEWLGEDKARPRKQRHTAKRIFERLRDECGFDGGYTIVKDYVRTRKRGSREMFVPLSHPPGHGQADFGEALVVIGGIERKTYFFAFDLPHSDACYIGAYPAANTEAWLDGHVHAFAFFGAVPRSILYDNDRCLVAKIMPDGTRNRTQRFSAMLSHYVIGDRYGRPGKGNDKGKVEGLVGYARRNFMVPMPCFADWGSFNDYLEEQCRKRQADILLGHKTSIGERLEADLGAMRPVPAAPFEACDLQSGQVTSTSQVRYRGNDYSVPVAYGHREVWIKGFVTRVVIGCAAEVIADHPRSYGTGDMMFDPVHDLPLIERKIMAFDQAAPLQGWDLPEAFATLQRLLEAKQGNAGKREYVQVLRLLERFEMEALHLAIKDALQMRAVSFDAIKHLLLCRIERRPPRLDLDVSPFLPRTNIATTSAASYMSLLAGGGV
ncbi:transposase [Rhodobacteraceae bacterium (ex Bugula neritina AB1)]|nr:transposase [Rhodobacteraceae bacterium (ex Bugula neritina AB1)]